MEKKDFAVFAETLLKDFCDEITGDNKDLLTDKEPDSCFIVGRLSPKDEIVENNSTSNIIIHSIGYNVFINKDNIENAEISIFPRGNLYYRVMPNLEQQRAFFINDLKSSSRTDCDSYDELIRNHMKSNGEDGFKITETCNLAPVYKRARLENEFQEGIIVKLKWLLNNISREATINSINKSIDEKINELRSRISNKDDAFVKINEPISIMDLENQSRWNAFIQKVTLDSDNHPLGLDWMFSISVKLKSVSDESYKLAITFTNDSKYESQSGSKGKKDYKNRINTLFNAGIKTKFNNCNLVPIEMDYFKDDYKYDRKQYAVGINCTPMSNKEHTVIDTDLLPVFKQYRLKTNEQVNVNFDALYSDAIPTLNKILSGMYEEKNRWIELINERKINKQLTSGGESKFIEEINDFGREIKRFEVGVSLIKNNSLINKSFKLMNEAFMNTAKGYTGWRMFQIVFIVSLITDLATCESDILDEQQYHISKMESMDLLYFPTGGGKTEAFLGVLVFNIFFDRLRGKKAGVTAILKYPLRLLSVQQMQRISNILAAADKIRNRLPKSEQGDEFSLGYLVGENNTPNDLDEKRLEIIKDMSQERLNEKFKILDFCPYCGSTEVNVIYNEINNTLEHICKNEQCPSCKKLPLYIVDTEIYRNLPTVIVATIDKMATIGIKRDFRQLLGLVDKKCSKHGYFSDARCPVYGCDGITENIVMYDSAPSLIIQDELHLVRESLGTYAAHYETFIQYFIQKLSKSRRPAKLIGATATISSYEEQVSQLYNKIPIRFPCESPDIERDFYSKVDKSDLQRLVLGYAPFGRAVINSVVYSLKYMRIVLEKYKKNPKLVFDIEGISVSNVKEAEEIIMNYWTILEYNNVKVDGNNVINALDDPINTELNNEGYTKFEPRKMTGDDTFQDVRRILAEVENIKNPIEVFNAFNIIVATSMISHGVDADRFNNMFFFGIPGNVAEYIQAYSRAGRKYTGIIIDIMRPMREKDQSYMKNFIKVHEYKDILVEPVPINRWASKAIYKTIPGVFSGLIICYYDYMLKEKYTKIYMMDQLQEALREGAINQKDVKEQLFEIYGCSSNGSERSIGNHYRLIIDKFVTEIFETIQTANFNRNTYIISGLEQIGYPIMKNLRDTDESLKIGLR